ncbi:MAG: NAD(+) synthase, partial [Bacteroidales bacterium]|nr:NAD(+) synthase [Bacteroidales bacterium]
PRTRGNLLLATANTHGAIVLNTSNKSEAVCGYGTLYGDLCGGLSVLGDLYKSQVYALAHYINRKKEIVPQNSITKAPSAELRPGQKDSDSLPDYDLIEKIMRLHLEQHLDEKALIGEGCEEAAVKRVLGLFVRNEYKRRQTPPIVRLSTTCLGADIRLPL